MKLLAFVQLSSFNWGQVGDKLANVAMTKCQLVCKTTTPLHQDNGRLNVGRMCIAKVSVNKKPLTDNSDNLFHWGQAEDKSANMAMTQLITSAQKTLSLCIEPIVLRRHSTLRLYKTRPRRLCQWVVFFSGLQEKKQNRLNRNGPGCSEQI